MEAVVRSSGLNWVIARPPVLGDGPATGNVLVFEHTAYKITRADLADWLVRQLEDDTYLGQAVVIANS